MKIRAAAVALLALLGGCGGDGEDKSAPAAGTDAAAMKTLLDAVPQRGTALGASRAELTLVEFTDLRCAPCRSYELNVLPMVVRDYVRPGKLRLELRTIGLNGPDSLDAAAWAAAAARQNRLYQFTDLSYRSPDEPPERIAADAGLDLAPARRYATSAALRRRLARTTEQARGSGVRQAPAFFVGRRGGTLQQIQVETETPASMASMLDSLLAGR